jgi:DNA-binding response OmpR family regulator
MNQEALNGILRAEIGARAMEAGTQILLVEDDEDLRVLMRTLLRYNGYSVTEACDCHTALDLLQRLNFELVLLDINLPDGNGFSVAEAIRENHLTCKVIVVTGTAGIENALQGAALGVHDYISKPFKPQFLLRSIEHALSVEHSG